uniref:Transcription activation suppressor family member 2 n=1 Tax=Homo sapiens TaxID=9606 RepID=A0A8Q3SI30_HUMAN
MGRRPSRDLRSSGAAATPRTAFMTLTENRTMSRILRVYLVKMN